MLLFTPYLSKLPTSRRGLKRIWVSSNGLIPGRWEYREYSITDAIDNGLFEFDDMGQYWDFYFEEWVPFNPELAENTWIHGIENEMKLQVSDRNSDFRDYKFRVIQSFASFIK